MSTTAQPERAFDGTFDWTIDEERTWPPRRRPRPPYGPTMLEIIRSCPLRACFEVSPGYEPRLDPAARVGTAFHHTLESLIDRPPAAATPEAWGAEAHRRFLDALACQRAEAAARPRERSLPWDEARVHAALETVVAEAMRLVRCGIYVGAEGAQPAGAPASTPAGTEPLRVEIPVQSRDRCFHGAVDQAERSGAGIRLIDLKSTLRSDLPERYERQLQLYAAMWHDTYGEWPVEAVVVYPFTGARFPVAIDPSTCQRVAEEARALVRQLEVQRSADALATPGEVCQVCQFRPWCRPFWKWQAQVPSLPAAIGRAALGWEGTVRQSQRTERFWRLAVHWRGMTVQVVAEVERFAHLERVRPGTRLRLLEVPIRGAPPLLQATAGPAAEIFIVLSPEDGGGAPPTPRMSPAGSPRAYGPRLAPSS
jgi:hypothetical protein